MLLRPDQIASSELQYRDYEVRQVAYANSPYSGLPEPHRGKWVDKFGRPGGVPGDSWFKFNDSSISPIEYVQGQPNFAPHVFRKNGIEAGVEIRYDGDLSLAESTRRSRDYASANKAMQKTIPKWTQPDKWTWHHQSINPVTGRGQMVLVPTKIHQAATHDGAYALYKSWLIANEAGNGSALKSISTKIGRLGVIGKLAKGVAAPLALISAVNIAQQGYAQNGILGAGDALIRDMMWADEIGSVYGTAAHAGSNALGDYFHVGEPNSIKMKQYERYGVGDQVK